MSESTQQLHDLLQEMVTAYATEDDSQLAAAVPTQLGEQMHPILDRMCQHAEEKGASDIFISTGFPPSLKINSVLTPVPLPALTAKESAEIVASTMNLNQQKKKKKICFIGYPV